MAVKQPIIDQRDQQQLVEQIYQLLLAYCPEWQTRDAIRLDQQAEALVQIFSRMGEMVIRHLNQVPEKNLRTFLDLVGTGLKPPQVAKAPLVFSLAAGAGNYGFVPAGTQVAAAIDSEKPVVFETDSDLTVILPRLVRAVSLNPRKDLWQEQRFAETPPVPAAVFGGKELVPHRLYLGHSQLFDIKGNTIVSIRFDLKEINAGETAPWEVKWYCFTDGQPTLLTPYGVNREGKDSNRVVNLLQSGTIYFNNINGIAEHTLTGIEQETGGEKVISQTSRWIFAELSSPITNLSPERLPLIRSLKTAVNFISTPTGRGLISSKGTDVFGKKTNFAGELKPGDILIAKNQTRIVKSIISETLLTVNDHFNPDLAEETAFHFAKFGTGTLSCKKGSRQVMGKATLFAVELQKGYSLIIGEKVRKITTIDGDNQLTVDEPFTQEIPDGTLFSYMPTPVIYLDKGFINEFPLDVSKDFYPFGERPRFNDTFYLGSGEVFSKQGAEITIRVELTSDSWVFHDNIRLNWEYWDGRSWAVLGETSSRDGAKTPQFEDTSRAFTTKGEIRFTCPKIERHKFQGNDNYWMRVRIVKGNYGEDAKYFEQAIAG
ncbi:MAG TPA: hypothetical protein VEC37_15635, partial [Bacillota bacterium]|nr:hypothetical protein [Bacillota bacterium]